MGIYSKDDLFTLWLNFRGQHDELRMMQDFALCGKQEAEALIAEFELLFECSTLDGSHRGKEHREDVQYCATKKRRGRPPKTKNIVRERFPEIAALVNNPPATYTQAPDTPLISRLTAAEIIRETMERATIK